MEQTIELNAHNKAEFPPMHTAEHLLKMNELIQADLPVTYEYVQADEVPEGISLDRLPEDASEMLRLVRIGDYDLCPCIGLHVASTRELVEFILLGTNWDAERENFRIRFKLGVK